MRGLLYFLLLATLISCVLPVYCATNIDCDDSNIKYMGRVSGAGTKAVSFDWPGVSISAVFNGTSIAGRFDMSGPPIYFNVFIDGSAAPMITVQSATSITLASGLADTQHTVLLTKRFESWGAAVVFRGFTLDTGKALSASSLPSRKIEFYGDSWTAGYGDEGDASHDTTLQCNNYYAYSAVTGRHFNADYRSIAISGIGMVHNNSDPSCPSAKPLSYYTDCTLQAQENHNWNFSSWVPDVVTVYLGINDFSGAGTPTQGVFQNAYTTFLQTMRSRYPNAEIFCFWDGQYPSYGSFLQVMSSVNGAVSARNSAGDSKVHAVDLNLAFSGGAPHGAETHPNVSEHQQLANKVIAAINSVMNWDGGSSSYSLTASASPSGSGSVALNPSGGTYSAGTTVTLTASANSGYNFSNWGGGASGTSNPTSIMVNSNTSVIANFSAAAVNYSLAAAVSPSGTGSVVLTPSGGTYTAGTVVTLMATPNSGYNFAGWSGSASGSGNPTTVTMSSNRSVTASFSQAQPNTYTLSVNATPAAGGTVSLNPFAASYAAGTAVTLTATANSGYSFASWSGAATGTSNIAAVTVNSNTGATANFAVTAPASYLLTVAATPAASGTVSVNPSRGSYTAGTLVTLTASANSGYSFTSWSGAAGGTSATVQITMDSNKSVTAVFSTGQAQPPLSEQPGTIVNKTYSYADSAGDATDFVINLNQPSAVELKIYTLAGKLVNSMSQSTGTGDNTFTLSNMLPTGGRLARGLYIYSLMATNENGATDVKTGKFIVQY